MFCPPRVTSRSEGLTNMQPPPVWDMTCLAGRLHGCKWQDAYSSPRRCLCPHTRVESSQQRSTRSFPLRQHVKRMRTIRNRQRSRSDGRLTSRARSSQTILQVPFPGSHTSGSGRCRHRCSGHACGRDCVGAHGGGRGGGHSGHTSVTIHVISVADNATCILA